MIFLYLFFKFYDTYGITEGVSIVSQENNKKTLDLCSSFKAFSWDYRLVNNELKVFILLVCKRSHSISPGIVKHMSALQGEIFWNNKVGYHSWFYKIQTTYVLKCEMHEYFKQVVSFFEVTH